MSNSIAPGSSADVNVRVTALTTNPNVPVQYKTIILKKNLVNGVNTLTQEMMSVANIKYVIKYDYVLGENITVPANCVLEFDGGSIKNISGSSYVLTCSNTDIYNIKTESVELRGTYNIKEYVSKHYNVITVDVLKTYQDALPVVLRTDSDTIVEGAPTTYNDPEIGQIYNRAPMVILNTTLNKIYACFKQRSSTWGAIDVYYSSWDGISEYALTVNKTYYYFDNNGFKRYCRWNGTSFVTNETEQVTINLVDQNSINEEGKEYSIYDDIDLNMSTLNLPAYSTIVFKGGKFKNGIINCNAGGITFKCPDKVCFENIKLINVDSSSVFKDIWFSNIFENNILAEIKKISLHRDYTITNPYYRTCVNSDLEIFGNGHTISYITDTTWRGKTFLRSKKLAFHDITLNFHYSDNANKEALSAIFDTFDVAAYNITYNGYGRLFANWSWSYTKETSKIEMIHCTTKNSDFLVEGRFDKIYIKDSNISCIDETTTAQSCTLLSVGTLSEEYSPVDCFIEIEDSYFGGLIEDTNGADSVGYSHIDIRRCELLGFTIANHGGNSIINGPTKIIDCTINAYGAFGTWNTVSSLEYINCIFLCNARTTFGTSIIDTNVDTILRNCCFYKKARGSYEAAKFSLKTRKAVSVTMIDNTVEDGGEIVTYTGTTLNFKNNRIVTTSIIGAQAVYVKVNGNRGIAPFNGSVLDSWIGEVDELHYCLDYITESFSGYFYYSYYGIYTPFFYNILSHRFEVLNSSGYSNSGNNIFPWNFEKKVPVIGDTCTRKVNDEVRSVYYNGNVWERSFSDYYFAKFSGDTNNRPSKMVNNVGFRYFDTTIGKPIFLKTPSVPAKTILTINTVHSTSGNITIAVSSGGADATFVIPLPTPEGATTSTIAAFISDYINANNLRYYYFDTKVNGNKVEFYRHYDKSTVVSITITDTDNTGLGTAISNTNYVDAVWVDATGATV